MLIRKEVIEEDCLLGIWEITETSEQLLEILSPENQREAYKYLLNIKSKKRVLEWA